jgi:hypothetical protein
VYKKIQIGKKEKQTGGRASNKRKIEKGQLKNIGHTDRQIDRCK